MIDRKEESVVLEKNYPALNLAGNNNHDTDGNDFSCDRRAGRSAWHYILREALPVLHRFYVQQKDEYKNITMRHDFPNKISSIQTNIDKMELYEKLVVPLLDRRMNSEDTNTKSSHHHPQTSSMKRDLDSSTFSCLLDPRNHGIYWEEMFKYKTRFSNSRRFLQYRKFNRVSQRTNNNDNNVHICHICGKSFLTRYYLDTHIDFAHSRKNDIVTHSTNRFCPGEELCKILGSTTCIQLSLDLEPYYAPGSGGRGFDSSVVKHSVKKGIENRWHSIERMNSSCKENHMKMIRERCISMIDGCLRGGIMMKSNQQDLDVEETLSIEHLKNDLQTQLCEKLTCKHLLHQMIKQKSNHAESDTSNSLHDMIELWDEHHSYHQSWTIFVVIIITLIVYIVLALKRCRFRSIYGGSDAWTTKSRPRLTAHSTMYNRRYNYDPHKRNIKKFF